MAVQINTDELKGCKSYFNWIFEQVKPAESSAEDVKVLEALCRLLFDTDYIWEIEEDGIRAKDATDIRQVYAKKVGAENGKNEREIDRIWKSVHGKCSVLELIYGMCVRLDEMVNEGETGSMISEFFRILCGNLGFFDKKFVKCSDFDWADELISNKIGHEFSQGWHNFSVSLTQFEHWKACILRFMSRKYDANGSGGGLFPLRNWVAGVSKDQRKVSIWYQMNTWLDENLDDEAQFSFEKFMEN